MFAYAVCVLGTHVRRGHQSSWRWSYIERFRAIMWVLGTSPRLSAGAASAILTSELSGILNCSVGGRDELSWHRKVWVDPL